MTELIEDPRDGHDTPAPPAPSSATSAAPSPALPASGAAAVAGASPASSSTPCPLHGAAGARERYVYTSLSNARATAESGCTCAVPLDGGSGMMYASLSGKEKDKGLLANHGAGGSRWGPRRRVMVLVGGPLLLTLLLGMIYALFLRPPSISVRGVRGLDYNYEIVRFDIKVDLQNPNLETAALTSVNFNVSISTPAGVDLALGLVTGPRNIPGLNAGASTSLLVPALFTAKELGKEVFDAVFGAFRDNPDKIVWQVTGTFETKAWFIRRRIKASTAGARID